jgi:hypothetical protein
MYAAMAQNAMKLNIACNAFDYKVHSVDTPMAWLRNCTAMIHGEIELCPVDLIWVLITSPPDTLKFELMACTM